jgi:hypothetical protein
MFDTFDEAVTISKLVMELGDWWSSATNNNDGDDAAVGCSFHLGACCCCNFHFGTSADAAAGLLEVDSSAEAPPTTALATARGDLGRVGGATGCFTEAATLLLLLWLIQLWVVAVLGGVVVALCFQMSTTLRRFSADGEGGTLADVAATALSSWPSSSSLIALAAAAAVLLCRIGEPPHEPSSPPPPIFSHARNTLVLRCRAADDESWLPAPEDDAAE